MCFLIEKNHNKWILASHESWNYDNLIKNKSKINYEAELSTNPILNDEIKKKSIKKIKIKFEST
jgi:hypothetical protein